MLLGKFNVSPTESSFLGETPEWGFGLLLSAPSVIRCRHPSQSERHLTPRITQCYTDIHTDLVTATTNITSLATSCQLQNVTEHWTKPIGGFLFCDLKANISNNLHKTEKGGGDKIPLSNTANILKIIDKSQFEDK